MRIVAEFPDGPPLLQVVVDTEEEFDWSAPFNRDSTSVRAMEAQGRAQEVFAAYGIRPTYVIDYPVATDRRAAEILGGILRRGDCQIGTHLHPWVNPPFTEPVSAVNSYPGNLPADLERRKLERLHAAIAGAFGQAPVIYKAGRYGFGANTGRALAALGYRVDLSVVPHTSFGADGGPDFRGWPDRPFWHDAVGGLLEIPMSRGFAGVLRGATAARLFGLLEAVPGGRLMLSAASRARLLERPTLTPEGVPTASHRRRVRSLLRERQRVLTLSYHSPSLEPGHTPYVRDAAQLAAFLGAIRAVLDHCIGELGCRPTTPLDVRALALAGAGAGP